MAWKQVNGDERICRKGHVFSASDTRCPQCGEEDDVFPHRIYECPVCKKSCSQYNREIPGLEEYPADDPIAEADFPRGCRECLDTMQSALDAEPVPEESRQDNPPTITLEHSDGRMKTWREVEKELIKAALRKANGSVEMAARSIGMGRATLYRRLATYDQN